VSSDFIRHDLVRLGLMAKLSDSCFFQVMQADRFRSYVMNIIEVIHWRKHR